MNSNDRTHAFSHSERRVVTMHQRDIPCRIIMRTSLGSPYVRLRFICISALSLSLGCACGDQSDPAVRRRRQRRQRGDDSELEPAALLAHRRREARVELPSLELAAPRAVEASAEELLGAPEPLALVAAREAAARVRSRRADSDRLWRHPDSDPCSARPKRHPSRCSATSRKQAT